MELVLPNNYVEIEEEEMMYLDGGYWMNMSRNSVRWIVDGSLAAITLGISLWAGVRTLIRYFGKKQTKAYVTSAITRMGVYYSMALSVSSFVMTLLDWTPGGAIAYALDRFDRSGLNGRIQF